MHNGEPDVPTSAPASMPGDASSDELRRLKAELAARLGELEKANQEIRDMRRAALNLLEDAISSREVLRQSETRQAFLLRLSDELRLLKDPVDIQTTTSRMLGEHLGASRVGYAEAVDDTYIVIVRHYKTTWPGIEGRYQYDDYGRDLIIEFKAGRTVVRNDTSSDSTLTEEQREAYAALKIGAAVNKPLIRDQQFVAVLFVHFPELHEWTEYELSLINETAERTWVAVERARSEAALQRSEAHLSGIFSHAAVGLSELTLQGHFLRVNYEMCRILNRTQEETLQLSITDVTHPEDIPLFLEKTQQLLNQGGSVSLERRYLRPNGETVWCNSSLSMVGGPEPESRRILAVTTDISASMKAERALRESEERLQKAISIGTVGVIFFNLDGSILDANEAFALMSGYSREDFLEGRVRWDELTPPEFMPVTLQSREQLLATGVNTPYEKQYIRPDGSRWWGRFAGKCLNENECVEFVIDITESKQSEAALRASEEHLQLVMDSVTEYSIISTDAQGIITGWNTGAETMFGHSESEALSQSIDLIFTQGDREAGVSEDERREAVNHGRAADERWHQRKDGALFWMSGVTTPLYKGGQVNGFVKVARDLTEQRRAEAIVRDSEARFRTLSDAVPQLVWTNNAAGEANYFNQRWYEFTGLTPQESIGPGWQRIVHPDDANASIELWKLSLRAGVIFDTEYRLRGADGTYRWFIGRNVPLHDADGGIASWFGTATDIQALKEAESALRQSEELLRVALESAELGAWDWDIAHNAVNWSERHFYLLGLRPTQGSQTPEFFFQFVHPDDREHVANALTNAVDTAGSYQAEFRIFRADDNELRWMSAFGSTIEKRDGRATRMTGVMYDSTERITTAEALRQAHDELEFRVVERTHELALALDQLQTEAAQRRQLETDRAALMKRIVTTQEEERGRISRELHDNLGQHLTAVMLGLQGLENQITEITGGKRQNGAPQLEKMRKLVDGLMRAAHRQSKELRPAELDAMGVAPAVGQYIRDWMEMTGVPVDFQAIGWENHRIDPAIETTLYRVVQEALTNVTRHAHATQVGIVLELTEDTASVIVEDNGRGFDPEQKTGRLGLLGMKERLSIVNGTLNIESSAEEGTTVFARVPLQVSSD